MFPKEKPSFSVLLQNLLILIKPRNSLRRMHRPLRCLFPRSEAIHNSIVTVIISVVLK